MFNLRKGILCLDYSPEWNILVTGGVDHVVRVWNPYVTTNAIAIMKGHSSAVIHIFINGRIKIIISISKDKNIRVWDLREQVCLQSIPNRYIPLGRFPITSVYYGRTQNILVCASVSLGILYGSIEQMEESQVVTSHSKPLCAALYNTNFKQVVSGCHGGIICVWDILRGDKLMQFSTSNKKGVEVTTMVFDGHGRCLITGTKDGAVKVWNFNTGVCLLELPNLKQGEITGIQYVNQKIYVCGWSKRITWYLDTKEESEREYREWKCYHSEDILSMDKYNNKLLATACYGGDIVIWNIDSGRAFCRFNAHESTLPLIPIRIFDNREVASPPKRLEGEVFKRQTRDQQRRYKKVSWATSKDTSGISRSPSRASEATSPARHRRALASAPPVLRGERVEKKRRGQVNQVSWTAEPTPLNSDGEEDSGDGKSRKKQKQEFNLQEYLDKPILAVEKALFLNSRERTSDTAILLTSCADGFLYAWSITPNGGMLGKFKATTNDNLDTSVSSMTTDPRNQILVTGDSNGYLKIWDIENYCQSKLEVTSTSSKLSNGDSGGSHCGIRLPDLIPDYCKDNDFSDPDFQETEEEVQDGRTVSLVSPPLLSSWRSHLSAVTHVEYVDRFKLLITASYDCNVRVWCLSGRYVGTFGHSVWQLETEGDPAAQIPAEIRKVASFQTLKVLNEGVGPHWEVAHSILEALARQKRQQTMLMNFIRKRSDFDPDSSVRVRQLLQRDPRIARYTDEQIEATWQKWKVKGEEPRIYASVHCSDLQTAVHPDIPKLMKQVSRLEQTESSFIFKKLVRSVRKANVVCHMLPFKTAKKNAAKETETHKEGTNLHGHKHLHFQKKLHVSTEH
nr:PREDICTED: WD repeat-containing protein on Y chromosome-like [Latimeria chalumnae]|eukprot:XP_014350913.1 PREDICTED: WD repeat-containing protein on Y chromosome-like [Latimeria chalumnae]